MSYRILEHTADLRIKVIAKTPEGLFREATMAIMQIMGKNKEEQRIGKEKRTRTIRLRSVDRTSLLIDFLNVVLMLSEINKESYTAIIFKKLTENEVEADLKGFPISKSKKDIKAVTYHEAQIRQNKNKNWETILVFDI